MPVAGLATTQNTATGLDTRIPLNVSATELAGTRSTFARPSIVSPNISQTDLSLPAVVESNFTAKRTSFAAPATTQNTSTVVTSQQPTETVPAAAWKETEASIAPTNIPQTAAVQSSVTTTQMPLPASATTQNASTVVADQPAQNTPAARWHETDASIVPASVVRTSVSQPAVVQSNFTAEKVSLAGAATTENTPTAVANQPAQTVSETGLAGTELKVAEPGIVPANNPQLAFVQSDILPAHAPLAQSATAQDTTTGETVQPTWNFTAPKISETESSIATTDIRQPAVIQSNVGPVRTTLIESAKVQDTTVGPASQPTRDVKQRRLRFRLQFSRQATLNQTSSRQAPP